MASPEPPEWRHACVVSGAKPAGRGSGRALAWGESSVGVVVLRFVGEEAAFDEPYNIRLHPTHGARSRAPRVPALRCILTPRGAGEPDRWADTERTMIIQRNEIVFIVLLTGLSFVTLSCQSKAQMPSSAAVATDDRVGDRGSPQYTKQRSWPSAYPQPTSLKGLQHVAVKVYVDRGIPSDRIAPGPFGEEIERLIVQELRNAGIMVVEEREAEAILSLNVYLSCEADGTACGHHTALELKQWVQLDRNTRIAVAAITWTNSYSNGISKSQVYCCLPDLLAVDARTLIKGFVQDFRKANTG